MDGIGELIEKLCIANLKLWAVCDQKAAFVGAGEENAEKLRDLMKKDLDLCKLRAELRKEINLRLGGPQGDNVKCYGGGVADPLDAPVGEKLFSVRTTKCLKRLGVRSLRHLSMFKATDLIKAKNFGATCLKEVRDVLGKAGLALASELTISDLRPSSPSHVPAPASPTSDST